MNIIIDQITDAGLDLSEQYEPAQLDLDTEETKFTAPLSVTVHVVGGGNNISVDALIESIMHFNCSRCLEGVTLPLKHKFKLYLAVEGRAEIDISDNLREEIVLGYPLTPLCKDDCLGLCAGCGKNLNKEKCSCKSSS